LRALLSPLLRSFGSSWNPKWRHKPS